MHSDKLNIFLDGDTKNNIGPANVNKKIIKYYKFKFVKSNFKLFRILETIYYIIICKVILFSGIPPKSHIIISKFFRKKTVYLMHGYLKYDNEINKLMLKQKKIQDELYLFNKVDLILCVSDKFMKWFIGLNPIYNNKTHYVFSGIDLIDKNIISNKSQRKDLIVITGGNRNIKNNKIICDCVKELNKDNYSIDVNVFGTILSNNENIIEDNHIKLKGQVKQENLYEELNNSKLFILNTTVESFGLSVIDALICGCNILIPYNCGVASIMRLKDSDIIFDHNDAEEIRNKIMYNLKNSNNKRIMESIDFNHYSWQNVTKRLVKICNCIYKGKEYKNIK